MTRKLRLTDLDLVLLSHAAARPDGMLLPPPPSVGARGKTLERALAKLLRLGLVDECKAKTADQAWREGEDGHGVALRIATAGRDRLGLDAARDTPADATAKDTGVDEAATTDPGEDVRSAEGAADDADGAEPAADSAPFAPGIRPGTKQARLVDCLSRPWGASIADLRHQLGWQAHTVRAALTGLRKKGYAVTSAKDERGVTVYRASPPAKAAGDAR